MKRDWDVIRAIMLMLEESNEMIATLAPDAIEGFPRELVCYNMIQMLDAGLAEGSPLLAMSGESDCVLTRLTFAGHELLDQIRPKTAWERIKRYINERGADLSLEAIKITAPIVLRGILRR